MAFADPNIFTMARPRREITEDYGADASLSFALYLEEKIRDFWAKKGYNVELSHVYTHFSAKMRSGRYDVRSNMKNALPIDWKPKHGRTLD